MLKCERLKAKLIFFILACQMRFIAQQSGDNNLDSTCCLVSRDTSYAYDSSYAEAARWCKALYENDLPNLVPRPGPRSKVAIYLDFRLLYFRRHGNKVSSWS